LRSRRRKDVPREPSGYFASLILIGANPGISQTRLADELVIDPPNVALILARMTEGGLVERTQDPSDRRRILLTLTPAGGARMQDALEFNSSQRRLVELALSAEEIGQLNGLLGKLRQFLRNAERLSGD
jgi:DNA-binding MarR family transcriptional regulator